MKTKLNKMLTALLSVCMIFSLMPMNAFAEDEVPTNSELITAITVPTQTVQEIMVRHLTISCFCLDKGLFGLPLCLGNNLHITSSL